MTDPKDLVARVADSLLRIEMELRQLDLWQAERPDPEAFQSTQPFCIDTLEFHQWLQFVFVERMIVIIEQGQPLPRMSGIAPMAEEHFRVRPESGKSLIQELEEIDRLLSGK